MEASFWHERWDKGEIGFHRSDYHPFLTAHFPGLQLPQGATILVPLCGKTLDMRWLVEQGYQVIGSELSEDAGRAFFDEQGWDYNREDLGPFVALRGREKPVTLLIGDFFALTAEHIGAIDGFYDRAATIALPADMRQRYIEHLLSLLPDSAKGLIITIEDAPGEHFDGPPFSVPASEVLEHFGRGGPVDPVAERTTEIRDPRHPLETAFRYRGRGVSTE